MVSSVLSQASSSQPLSPWHVFVVLLDDCPVISRPQRADLQEWHQRTGDSLGTYRECQIQVQPASDHVCAPVVFPMRLLGCHQAATEDVRTSHLVQRKCLHCTQDATLATKSWTPGCFTPLCNLLMDTQWDDFAYPIRRVRKGTYVVIVAQCAHCQNNFFFLPVPSLGGYDTCTYRL